MNEKKIVLYFMSKMIEKAQDIQTTLNHPREIKHDYIRVCAKVIEYYARMIIEKNGAK